MAACDGVPEQAAFAGFLQPLVACQVAHKLTLGLALDCRALREQRMRQAAAAQAAQGVPAEGEGPAQPPPDDGLYKGLNSYTDFRAGFRREQVSAHSVHV